MVGRKKEVALLNKLYQKNNAEFVAVYGRRRVGKTYLIDETFSSRFTFRHAGLSPLQEDEGKERNLLDAQLNQFRTSLIRFKANVPEKFHDWFEAFLCLENFLEEKDDGSRQLVFIDELPWMDTPRSGFVMALESFWNNWACHRKNFMLIVCGSANSWIIDKLINNHGGLYGRVTREIKLKPFSLKECEEYYRSNGIKLSRYDIVQSYMAIGGIPYYMSYFDSEKSLAQNIDDLFFEKNATLSQEFDRLFTSGFSNPDTMEGIVSLLYQKNMGFTRKEICEKLSLSDGGGLSKALNGLIASDFVEKYVPFGKSKREEYYKLIDPFCLFYLRFLSKERTNNPHFWEENVTSQLLSTWRGFAFENVCFNHIVQIKNALGISGVFSNESSWSKKSDEEAGTQIDLLIQRNDKVVNMCELKFYSDNFTVDKDYYRLLLQRENILLGMISKKSVVRSTLITTFGLADNEYSSIFQNVITLDDLFLI